MKRTLFTLLALAVAAGLLAEPGLHMPRGKWWTNPKAQETLNLSPQQIDRLNAIHTQYAEAMIDLNADVDKLRLHLGEIFDSDPFIEEDALRQMDAIQKAQQALHQARSQMFVKIRAQLTAQQWQSIKAFREFRRAERREGREGMRGDRPRFDGQNRQDRQYRRNF